MLKRLLHRPLLLILHIALVLIIIGATVTHFWGESAMLSLRVGETSSDAYTEKFMRMQLPFEASLVKFSVETYEDGKTHKNYVSHLKIVSQDNPNGEDAEVEMNHPYSLMGYSLLQMSYDPDYKGTTLLVQHDPWGVGVTLCGYYILLAASLVMLIRHLYRQRHNKSFWICVGISLLCASGYVIKKIGFSDAPLLPVLNSPYLIIHVSIIIVAYMLMLCMLVVSVKTLLKGNVSKSPNHQIIKSSDVTCSLLFPAVLLLSAGIFIGAIWANASWGRYWGWDPKETWALITLIVYALPLHPGLIKPFRNPKFLHIYICIAFLSVIITYFGVNFIIGGLHSYA